MFSTLRNRLFLTYGLIIAVVLLIVGFAIILFLIRNPAVDRQTYVVLDQLADKIVTRIGELNIPQQKLPGILMQEDELQDFRVLIVGQNQIVRFDSEKDDGKPIQPQIRKISQQKHGVIRDPDSNAWLFVWRPLEEGGYLVLARQRLNRTALLFSQRLRDVLQEDLLPPLVKIGFFTLLVALILAFWISNWVSRPLFNLSLAARSMSGGEFEKVPVSGPQEVRNLASAFNDMSDQVKASQISQRDFVANVSHELKTPLTSIQGFAHAILDGTVESQKDLLDAAEVIRSEAERMHRLVLQLLDLTRLTGGTRVMQQDPVNMGSLLVGVVERATPQAIDAQIEISYHPVELPDIIGDSDRLQQVFTNLVDNAIKYTPLGGKVSLDAAFHGSEVVVYVKDTGKGIDPDEIPRIFERFYQVDPSCSSGKERGTGLGLPIATEIIHAHRGSITVNSQPGQGSVFMVKIPVAPPKKAAN